MMHVNGIPEICRFSIIILTGQGFECISYLVQYLQQIEIKFVPLFIFLLLSRVLDSQSHMDIRLGQPPVIFDSDLSGTYAVRTGV